MSVDCEAGSSQYGTLASLPVTDVPFTISCFLRFETTVGMGIVGLYDTATENNYHYLGLQNASGIKAASTAGGAEAAAQHATAVSTGVWYHAGATFDVTTGTDRAIFLDGAGKVTSTTNRAATGLDTFAVGRINKLTPSNYFDGMIAHLAVWNVVLTDGEILSLARGTSPLMVRSTALKGYWPMGTPTETHRKDGAPNAITWNASPATGMNPPLPDWTYADPTMLSSAGAKAGLWMPGQLGVPDPILAAM